MPMCKTLLRLPAYTVWLLMLYCFTSCKAPASVAYFQTIKRDTTLQNTAAKDFDIKIKPDDQLAIGITSASSELSGQFNASQTNAGGNAGYLVDRKGNIQLYKLGDVRVAGLSRDELKEKLQKELSPYLKDPMVTVRFLNQRVILMGEVGQPGVLTFNSDQINILEALGQRGDLTKNARRDNILLIRQTDTGKEFRHLNLLDNSIFNSPYFYLQSEDIVYVEPEKKKTTNTQQIISYVLTGFSIVTLIVSRIK